MSLTIRDLCMNLASSTNRAALLVIIGLPNIISYDEGEWLLIIPLIVSVASALS